MLVNQSNFDQSAKILGIGQTTPNKTRYLELVPFLKTSSSANTMPLKIDQLNLTFCAATKLN